METSKTKKRTLIGQLGKTVILWNDLELAIRKVLLALTNDPAAAAILSADFSADNLFKTVRALASEYDAYRKRLNTRISIEADSHNKKPNLFEEVAGRVNHLIDRVEVLQQRKNKYVHEMHTFQNSKAFADSYSFKNSPSACSRLAILDDLAGLTAEISGRVKQSDNIIKLIQENGPKKSNLRIILAKTASSPIFEDTELI